MPKHRRLSLKRLIFAIPWDLFERYFSELNPQARPSPWAFLHAQVLEKFLYDPQNEAGPAILEDFQRMNDMAGQHVGLLIHAFERAQLNYDQEQAAEAMAMRLFVDDRDAFEYAWSLYLFQAVPSPVHEHRFPAGPLHPQNEDVERLKAYLSGWFSNSKKGEQCQIACFEDEEGLLIRISRGSYLRTVARWQGNEIDFETFRPASEDIIAYEAGASRLSVKCGVKRDREKYVRGFAEFIAGNAELADVALSERVFSLEPIRERTFEFGGAGPISRISLIEAHIKLPSLGEPVITVKSDNVLRTLAEDIPGISLDLGELVKVRMRFELRIEDEKRPREVSFEIAPPSSSELSQKTYARIIEEYLRDQGVKLI
jgi:hypothetical protein